MTAGNVAAVVALLSVMVAGQERPTTLLGVLEELPTELSRQASQPRIVRAVFQRIGGEWRAFPADCPDEKCLWTVASQYPQEVTWTVGFSGRTLGRVTSRTPGRFEFYADVGRQEITSSTPIPAIGKRSRAYGGWSGESVYRPLVANSKPFFTDPEAWKRAHLPSGVVPRLLAAIHKKYPEILRQRGDGCTGSPRPLRDADIEITRSYSSKEDWRLVEVSLNGCQRDDLELGWQLTHQWFVIDPKMKVEFLRDDMWLVDAGDYDNDGKSELLFAIDGYNRGGYILFYDDFKRQAVFEFGYH